MVAFQILVIWYGMSIAICQEAVAPSLWTVTSALKPPVPASVAGNRPLGRLEAGGGSVSTKVAALPVAERVPLRRLNSMGVRYARLAGFTVLQSSARMPPVSPEFGFHDQKVQLMPCLPAGISDLPSLLKSPPR